MDYGDYYWGLYRDYYRDPFPHSLLSTRKLRGSTFANQSPNTTSKALKLRLRVRALGFRMWSVSGLQALCTSMGTRRAGLFRGLWSLRLDVRLKIPELRISCFFCLRSPTFCLQNLAKRPDTVNPTPRARITFSTP